MFLGRALRGCSIFRGEAKEKIQRLNRSMGPQARGQPAEACLGRRNFALHCAGVRQDRFAARVRGRERWTKAVARTAEGRERERVKDPIVVGQ